MRVKHYAVNLDKGRYTFEQLSELQVIIKSLYGDNVTISHFSTDPITGRNIVHFNNRGFVIEAVHWGMCQQQNT